MKKYFILSDIHSFFYEMKKSLDSAGYQKENPEHILIVCGDVFDRGSETIPVYEFLSSIPKERIILIRGNHEWLYLMLLKKGFPEEYDFSNGTVNTFCSIAQVPIKFLKPVRKPSYDDDENTINLAFRKWSEIVQKVAKHPITEWIKSNQWVNFYELDKYIFVHSFIPVKNLDGLPGWYVHGRKFEFYPEWRTAHQEDWDDATWGCPWRQYATGLFEPEAKQNKTLVCGHWHTSDFFFALKNDPSYLYELGPIYYSANLIGLDGGCASTRAHTYLHPQNVLVINEENMNVCYNQNGAKLEEPEYKSKK